MLTEETESKRTKRFYWGFAGAHRMKWQQSTTKETRFETADDYRVEDYNDTPPNLSVAFVPYHYNQLSVAHHP